MEILSKILNNSELAEKIRLKCDIELYPQLQKPDDMDGKLLGILMAKHLELMQVEENLFYFLMEV